jgi:nitrogen fixation protein NifU and related proteins
MDDLYDSIVLDHSRHPRNHGALSGATHGARGDNPFCGDRVTVSLILEGDRIAAVGFEGAGCAISTASASMMTVALRGRARADAEALCRAFETMLGGGVAARDGTPAASTGAVTAVTDDVAALGELGAFAAVRRYPVRVKCARLPWQTLMAALGGARGTVSTE